MIHFADDTLSADLAKARASDRRARERVARALLANAGGLIRRHAGFWRRDLADAHEAAGDAALLTLSDCPLSMNPRRFFESAFASKSANLAKSRARAHRRDAAYANAARAILPDRAAAPETALDFERAVAAAATLSPRQRQAFYELARGADPSDLQFALNVSRQTAHEIHARMLANLRAALEIRAA